MEVARRAPIRQPAIETDRNWQIVKRWPGLSGEAKIAWRYLYLRSGGGNEQIAVKPVDLGHDQNTSDDAGNRYLVSLGPRRAVRRKGKEAEVGEGLIEIKDLGRGVKLVTLLDPLDVAKARRACGGDSQLAFSFLEELEVEEDTEYPPAVVRMLEGGRELPQPAPLETSAAVPTVTEPITAVPRQTPTADPPALPRPFRGSAGGSAVAPDKDKDIVLCAPETKTKTNIDLVYSGDLATPRNRDDHRGSAGGSAVAPVSIGQTLGNLGGLVDGSMADAFLERLKARIRDAVGDPAAEVVVIALAHAHVDERVKAPDLDRLLQRIRSGRDAYGQPIANRGGFFRRQVMFKFQELGIRPEDYLPRGPKPR